MQKKRKIVRFNCFYNCNPFINFTYPYGNVRCVPNVQACKVKPAREGYSRFAKCLYLIDCPGTPDCPIPGAVGDGDPDPGGDQA